jgi:hypothetical protein
MVKGDLPALHLAPETRRARRLEGPFVAPGLPSALRLAVRASSRPREDKSSGASPGLSWTG